MPAVVSAAAAPSTMAVRNREPYPVHPTRNTPSAGPIAMATFMPTPKYPIASPRRERGARSAARALAAVPKAAHPTPWNTRTAISRGTECTGA